MIKESYKIKVTGKGITPYDPSSYNVHANNNSCFKIYVVKNKKKFLYVGMAKQKIRTRFAGSFRAFQNKNGTSKRGYGGYSGYKWIEIFLASGKSIELTVFVFPNKTSKEDKCFFEAVEAEVVFLIRNNSPYLWPISQHEIHFHNIKEAKKVAKAIFKEVS